MATLVLSSVGTALGGPIGGMIGSMVGQSIDLQLMGGGARKGPRLNDLAVQTSSYGTPIPQIFGTMRVAGTVIWSTDLVETTELVGDAKSGGETQVYNYTASFAVAVSARRAAEVRRIWADGKLIRGAAGDLKVEGEVRFLDGGEGQAVDPLIATLEGLGAAPAYRGLSLVLFEDLALAGFGNRIPNLTFEIVGDGEAPSVGALLAEASEGALAVADAAEVSGYAWHGSDRVGAALPLVEAYGLDLADAGGALRTVEAEAVLISRAELGADGEAAIERRRDPASAVPSEVAITHYEPSRDYQSGVARASVAAGHRAVQSLDLPLVANADQAKAIAAARLSRAWLRRERMTVRLPLARAGVGPGRQVEIEGVSGCWLVETQSIERMAVELTLVPLADGPVVAPADPGRPVIPPDVVALPSRMVLLDLPEGAIDGIAGPTLQLAVASPSSTWRQVPLEIEVGGAVSSAQSAVVEAVIGTVDGVLADGAVDVVEPTHVIEVVLANPDKWLVSADEAALAAGANLAAVGGELVQFAGAEPLGAGRFVLSGLRRGLRGSETAMIGHGPDEAFVLIAADALKVLAFQEAQVGMTATVTALGVGNKDNPPSVSRVVTA